MIFEGWAVKRTDTGKFWNKFRRWNDIPTIYDKKGHATCAGKYHTNQEIKVVKVRITIDEE